MRFAGLRGEAGRVELGIRRSQLCSSSLFLPSTLLAFKGKVLTIRISEYSLTVGGQDVQANRARAWDFGPGGLETLEATHRTAYQARES